MRTNRKPVSDTNSHGVTAVPMKPFEHLKRTVMGCLLWEDGFYESGILVADRIKALVPQCDPDDVAELASTLRNVHNLRHAPLLLARELARNTERCAPGLIKDLLAQIIQRPDELTEFLALYWADDKVKDRRKRSPLAKQVKTGLARAFCKFNEYQLAKYNRDTEIKLRDVLFMVHAKPKDEEQKHVWERLIKGELATPDTWEVALSAGEDKGETFTRLIAENKLGGLALLRNLRNMHESGVSKDTVKKALLNSVKMAKVLPFRYIAAARSVPAWEDIIEQAMLESVSRVESLLGKTVILVDNSGSMAGKLSMKSDLSRFDAAAALAILLREIGEEVQVFSFSTQVAEVPPRHGFALRDAINSVVPVAATDLRRALTFVQESTYGVDRLVVVTDEQSQTAISSGTKYASKQYMIDVSTSGHSIAHGSWERISGFSESIVSYIQAMERSV